MPRTASRILTPLALLSCLGLSACATLTGGNPKTEMLVAIGVDQEVQPDTTIRYSGKAGDTVTVYAANEPPLTLVFARRSQVVKVSESSEGVAVDVKQGYTDPNRR